MVGRIINIGLGYGLWNNYKKDDSIQISMFSIPGGVVVVIPQTENNSTDVVVTGMARKKYTIEGKIISPQLEKLEVKNINSFKFVAAAIAYEVQRQTEAYEDGVYAQARVNYNGAKSKWFTASICEWKDELK